jgi:hypothetical protein
MRVSTIVACVAACIAALVVGSACIAYFWVGLLDDFSEITGVYQPPFVYAGLPMVALLFFSLMFARWRLSAARVFATVSVLLFFGYVLLLCLDARPAARWGEFVVFLAMAGASLFANWWMASLVRRWTTGSS